MRKHSISATSLILASACLFTVWSCHRAKPNPQEHEAERANQVYKLYRTADYATARPALVDYAQQLDKLVTSGPPDDAEANKSDLMVTYVRLAKLEEKNKGFDKDAFMKQAVTKCQQLRIKWGQCSEQELRERVDRLDTVSPKP